MLITLKHQFISNQSGNSSIKYLQDLLPEEKLLFIDFLKNIFNDNKLEGKNKPSAKLPPFINHDNLKNYATFLNNDIRHYHLGKDISLNSYIRYKCPDSAKIVKKLIYENNEVKEEYKACSTIVNYQIIDSVVIIYNITLHSAWTEIVNNLCIQGIQLDYTTCQYCSNVIQLNSKCACLNSKHITTIGVIEEAQITETLNVTLKRSGVVIEEQVVIQLTPYLESITNKDYQILNLRDIDKL